jgi:hypothetical protein
MFKLAQESRFKWPVTVRMPSPVEAGKVEEQTFIGLFRALPRNEALKLTEEMRAAETTEAIARAEAVQIAAILEGWEDVVDGDGAPTSFSAEALSAACEWPWFRDGLTRAYAEAMNGGAARLGN